MNADSSFLKKGSHECFASAGRRDQLGKQNSLIKHVVRKILDRVPARTLQPVPYLRVLRSCRLSGAVEEHSSSKSLTAGVPQPDPVGYQSTGWEAQ
jgi:hypothetical protein